MPDDPNIFAFDKNKCLSMTPGSPYWYESPDIHIEGDPAEVIEGTTYTIDVTVHWSDKGCAVTGFNGIPQDLQFVQFDLYIGEPTLLLNATPATSTISAVAAGQACNPAITPGGTSTTQVSWTPDSTDPHQAPGHKCFAARCYPATTSPPPETGDLTQYMSDQHYCQHNIDIEAAGQGGQKRIQIRTGNLLREPQTVTVQVRPDLNPSREALASLMPSLRAFPGFKRISNTPLRKISVDFSNFGQQHHEGFWGEIKDFAEEIEDKFEEFFKGHGDTAARAKVRIPPNFVAFFDVNADLSNAKSGDAFIYRVEQSDAAGVVTGGVSLVLVQP